MGGIGISAGILAQKISYENKNVQQPENNAPEYTRKPADVNGFFRVLLSSEHVAYIPPARKVVGETSSFSPK